MTVLVNRVMNEREGLGGRLHGREDRRALEDILNTGTSAGGARAKAVLAWNRKTGEFRSGQVDADDGHEHWILKFDGISNNRDRELADPQGFGRIEHAYWLMAKDADIEMSECRLHQEGGRSHFMTRRFDRSERGIKIHMQSLAALRHFDFNDPISYSYEQAADIILGLDLGMDSVEEQFRRAVFNAVARNQDDHVKNISFLMDGSGAWRLSPAYDVTFAYNSRGPWTGNHQMSMAGKRNDFTWEDIMTFASNIGVKAGRARRAIEGVAESVERWREHAEGAGIDGQDAERLEKMFRKDLYLSGVRATGKRKNRDK